MKIYYSNIASCDFTKHKIEVPKIGVLISYHGLGDKIKVPDYCDMLFLDSGAFSAWTQKVSISLDKYIEFIKKHEKKFAVYASLDDITSDKNSVDNYLKMREAGLNPMPTYHYGEPIEILNFYAKQTGYIALGGIAKLHKGPRIRWLDNIFEKYPDPSKTGFHGFGIQDRTLLFRYPWRTIDASSVHVMARYGGVCCPGDTGEYIVRGRDVKINPEVNPKDLRWKSPTTEKVIRKWVESCGVSYEEAQQSTPYGTLLRAKVNILYYESLAKQVPKIYERKSMPSLF